MIQAIVLRSRSSLSLLWCRTLSLQVPGCLSGVGVTTSLSLHVDLSRTLRHPSAIHLSCYIAHSDRTLCVFVAPFRLRASGATEQQAQSARGHDVLGHSHRNHITTRSDPECAGQTLVGDAVLSIEDVTGRVMCLCSVSTWKNKGNFSVWLFSRLDV